VVSDSRAQLSNQTMLLARDGREIPIDDCGSPIIDDSGEVTGTVLVFREVTQRRQTDAALRRAQAELGRVAQRTLVGELAAAIVHELSQPLTGVMTNVRRSLLLLETDIPDLEAVRPTARNIVRDAQRVADVILQIRRLVTEKRGSKETFNLNGAIHEVTILARDVWSVVAVVCVVDDRTAPEFRARRQVVTAGPASDPRCQCESLSQS